MGNFLGQKMVISVKFEKKILCVKNFRVVSGVTYFGTAVNISHQSMNF